MNFTVAQMRAMMDHPKQIRNMSVIAHVDHGKSTLTDALVSKAGIISKAKAGDARFTDTRQDEQDRCITIKSTGISLYFLYAASPLAAKLQCKAQDRLGAIEPITENKYLINLIDSPGHVDFSSEVTAALRVTDGALVVVDCVEGVAVQTEVVLRQALSERVKPVLHCNKLDRVLLELHLPPEDVYKNLTRVIENVNVVVNTYVDKNFCNAFFDPVRPNLTAEEIEGWAAVKDLPAEDAARVEYFAKLEATGIKTKGNNTLIKVLNRGGRYGKNVIKETILVDPCRGTVSFGTGLQQWGFTLVHFAQLYGKKFGIAEDVMLRNLWGERYFNPATSSFVNKSANGKLKRGFVHFILQPIYKLTDAVVEEEKFFSKKQNKEVLLCFKMFKQLGISLKKDERDFRGKKLLKRAMQRWLPAAEALMEMIVLHLPSPWLAQQYRTELLYEGPQDDRYATAMRACDPDGPLTMYVSKMVPTPDGSRFHAFGRVFSGKISTGKKCRIMGPNYVVGKKSDLHVKPIQRTCIMMGRSVDQVDDVPCGNTCALVGVDAYLKKSGTITDGDATDCHNISVMKFSVSPVVRVAVEPKTAGDLPKLVQGLNRLAKSDPMVQIIHMKTGEHVVAGAGELHLEICLKDLQEDFMNNTPVRISPPVVSYRETVTEEGPKCLAKSANKHNRIYLHAEPLNEKLVDFICDDKFKLNMNEKDRNEFMRTNFDWDNKETKTIWALGPDTHGPNMVKNETTGVQYLLEIKESVIAGFEWASGCGPLAEEEMRGVRFNLEDVTMHADSIHRGMGQIMPPTRRAMYAGLMTAHPSLCEPMYLAEITAPMTVVGGIYSTLSKRRGITQGEYPRPGTPLTIVKAFLPVAESFGFTAELRSNTGGQAFPQCVFDHWSVVTGNAMEKGMSHEIVMKIRKRKGIAAEIPPLSRYLDTL